MDYGERLPQGLCFLPKKKKVNGRGSNKRNHCQLNQLFRVDSPKTAGVTSWVGVVEGITSVLAPCTSGVKPCAGWPGSTPGVPAIAPVLTSFDSLL